MLATGRGLVVLDCDTQRAITQAHEQLGVPEATPTLSTPRGGRHFYLAGRAPNRTDFQPGIDLRGSGGYAVGAGARRPDGVYEWIVPPWEVEEAPIPAELERLIREIKKGETARRAPGQLITTGIRTRYLAAKGGSMRRAGMSAEATRDALHAENITVCRPPLKEREVDRIVKSSLADGGSAAVGRRPVGADARRAAVDERAPSARRPLPRCKG